MLGTYGVYYGHDGDRLLFRGKNNRSVTVEFSEDMKTVAAVSSAQPTRPIPTSERSPGE